MSEAGYVRIHRRLLGHPAFRNDAEAMAFAWMVVRAAWQPTRVRYKDRLISLQRSQLSVSVRDMATALDRDKAWIERLWKRLKSETMIETATEAGVSVVTICNYDDYQGATDRSETPRETPSETGARQGRDTEQRREEVKKIEDVVGGARERTREADPAPELANDFPSNLIALTDELCRAAGVRHIDPNRIIEHQAVVREWLAEGIDPQAHMLPAIRQSVAANTERIHSLRWFANPIRQFRARLEANDHGYSSQNRRRSDTDYRDPLLAEHLAGRG